jgi:hypothetical protein
VNGRMKDARVKVKGKVARELGEGRVRDKQAEKGKGQQKPRGGSQASLGSSVVRGSAPPLVPQSRVLLSEPRFRMTAISRPDTSTIPLLFLSFVAAPPTNYHSF